MEPGIDSVSVALGIDAGGSRTRWALADLAGNIVAEGAVAGFSVLQMASHDGRQGVHAAVTSLAQAVLAAGRPCRVRAGLTGFGGEGEQLRSWLAQGLDIVGDAITLCNDIEIAYLDSFEPGQGYLVYAGTGSIAALIDTDGVFHRAGGRGFLLDDGGGGFWIAREALRHIWRREDECPGSWAASPMAVAVFEQIGGSGWDHTRSFIYGQDRGAVGTLALAVAASAADPAAYAILQEAGRELARLARAMVARHGPRPVVLAGRASTLHSVIAATMRAHLPGDLPLRQQVAQAHLAAARIAARDAGRRVGS